MDFQQADHYLCNKPEALKDYPFGPEVAVYKIKGKMFATLSITGSGDNTLKNLGIARGTATMNLKCNPDQALALRDIFPAVIPGYHMNKKHWNTVILNQTIPEGEIERMIDHSYTLVMEGLTRAQRQTLETRYPLEELYKD